MLTVQQVADKLGVSPALVYGWVNSGTLPCYRLGQAGRRGSIRVAEADVDAFLAGQKTVTKEEPVKVKKFRHLKLD
jgi:excisionase family DNA binding protein